MSRRGLVLTVSAIVVGTLTLGLVGGTALLSRRIDAGIERIDDPFGALPSRAPDPASVAGGAEPMTILMLGSDSRISAGDPTQWSYGAQRTDAIMLVHVPADRSGAYVISIPRDSWVPVPGYGDAKVNAAFSYGGPSLLIQTVEQLTGVHIDHFAVADFESFAALTDAVGGVEITVPADTYDRGRLVASAGTHLLDGEDALAYARQRYGLPGGDFDRMQRQQNWIRAIARSAFDRDVLGNPTALTGFLLVASRSVAVDEGFSLGVMRDLALGLRSVDADDLVFITAPVAGTGRSPDGSQSVVFLDEARFGSFMQAVAEDRLSEYLGAHPGELTVLTDVVN